MDEKLKILFVDDDEAVLEGYDRVLRKKRGNWEMRYCSDGQEALSEIGLGGYDVLVTDMIMPGVSGKEMMEEARKKHPEMVRVIMSGYSGDEVMLDTVKLAHQYLRKPCVPEQLMETIGRAYKLRRLLKCERLKQLVGTLENIPSMPQMYMELMEALRDEQVNLERLEGVIMEDAGMAAKILSVSNSAYFGVPHSVTRVKEALGIMGVNMIKSMILGAGVFERMNPKVMKYMPMGKFWEHALYTGLIARKIAEGEGASDDEVEACFMGGLLHTVGVLILANNFVDEYKGVYGRSISEGVSLSEEEKKAFGAEYGHVGGYVLSMWGLSESVVEAVAFHGDPRELGGGTSLSVMAVHVASEIAKGMIGEERWFYGNGIDWEFVRSVGYREKVVGWIEGSGQVAKR